MISPYLLIFAMLFIAYLISVAKPKFGPCIFILSLTCLTVFLGLREWQGTDYNMYRWLYDQAPGIFEMTSLYFTDEIHGEIGWKIMMSALKTAGISFEVFIAALTCFNSYCFYRFVNRYSSDKQLSLLLAYPNLYLVYFASGLRQGLVISVFLGFMLELLERNRNWAYFTVCILLSFIHSSSLILLLAAIALRLSFRQILSTLGVFTVVGIIPALFPGTLDALSGLPYLGYYFAGNESIGYAGISPLSTARRLFWLVLILVLSVSILRSAHYRNSARLRFLLKIYVSGASFFCLLISVPSAGSRFFAAFQMLELALIPLLCDIHSSLRCQIRIISIAFSIVLVWNVMSQFVLERDYRIEAWYSYPYYTVFTPPEEVIKDRPSLYDLP